MAKSTEHLGLYEKESTDSKDTFNITTMLNNNWDKLDADSKAKADAIASMNSTIGTANLTTSDKTIKGAINEVKNSIPTVPTKTSQLTNDGNGTHSFATTDQIPTSLPANGGNSTTVHDHTAAADPLTKEKIDLIGMVNEVKNGAYTKTESDTAISNGVNSGITGVITSDFTGKVTGSVVENPNIMYWSNKSVLIKPSDTDLAEDNYGYDFIKTLDGNCKSQIANANGGIGQQLYAFDLISIVERKYGTIPGSTTADKVTWLKNNLANITCSWWGYGSCPSGNKANLITYASDLGRYYTESISTTTLNTVSKLTRDTGMSAATNDGFVYFLAYTDASDGTTPSVINTDYINIQLAFKNIFSALMQLNNNVDGIQIGGRNLLRNSNFYNGLTNWSTNYTDSATIENDNVFGHHAKITVSASNRGLYAFPPRAQGKMYTFSAYLKSDSSMTVILMQENSISIGCSLTTEWQKFSGQGIFNGSGAFCIYSIGSGTFYVANVKFEEGNKPTDWTPAPEDQQAYVDAHIADNSKHIPHLGTTTNSGDNYSITTEVINANEKFTITFNAPSTSAPTLSVNGGYAYPIKKQNGNPAKLYASNYMLFWNGSNFQLLGEGGDYGTATSGDVLETKTFGTEDGIKQGSIPICGAGIDAQAIAKIVSNGKAYMHPPEGTYFNGGSVYTSEPDLSSDNIKAGKKVFGIDGKSSVVDTADATATAPQIRNGQTAYVNGNKVTGSCPVQATSAQTVTPVTSDIVKPAGIYDETITIKGDSNLIASNIPNDISLFGIQGASSYPLNVTSGDNLIVNDSTQVIVHINDYLTVKRKEIQINMKGIIKVSFDMHLYNTNGSTTSYKACAQIYKNGNPIGTLRNIISQYYYQVQNTNGTINDGLNWATFIEDIPVNKGDLLQLYTVACDFFYGVYLQNFKVTIAEDPNSIHYKINS